MLTASRCGCAAARAPGLFEHVGFAVLQCDLHLAPIPPAHGLRLAILLSSAPVVVIGVPVSLEEKVMKRIDCTDGPIATKVRAMLARHGILRGIYHTGP